ncbi:Hep/Hag repeat protein [Actinobacillus ureae ATCC 25976]|uniref:Hep/Hag repeat protein n=1 Tax=Actinobacillus ureae ATCC 25976 TaxID=887324 RepID=E8KKC4_9PAST|nr:ESPR-type extended signal peptide-containing protein [Actinobacillus ureae]EFX90663.1 Hep/Hag repeat protein [Actinobacillus ureae ATCC 25976]
MNKIFRVIWNEAPQSWTAVSELAKGRVKSSSQSKVIDEITNDSPTLNLSKTNTITTTLAILGGTLLASDALAIQATIVGKSLNTSGMAYNDTQGLAIGFGNATGNSQAIAIGGDTIANGAKASGAGAVAVGAQTTAGLTSVALGWNAKATANNTVALGSSTTATIPGSVAIGANSETKQPLLNSRQLQFNQPDVIFNTDNGSNGGHSFAGNIQGGVVSVGNTTSQRQIQYVAPGEISQTSTDAVNGSQLYNVIKYLGFNVRDNGVSKSRINNNNYVNFINGSYTTTTVTDTNDGSKVTYNVITQAITSDAVTGQATATATTAGLATSTDVVQAVNNVAQIAKNANDTATEAKTTADAASTAVLSKADANLAYKFNIANSENTQQNNSGEAEGWTLSKNDEITFGATSDLEVSTDGSGKIVYGLSTVAKTAISAASDAAKTVADNLTKIEDSVKEAKDAATNAKDSEAKADAAKTAAETARDQATTAATAAADYASAASSSASAADSSATKAAASASAASSSATAADSSATKAEQAEQRMKKDFESTNTGETTDKLGEKSTRMGNNATAKGNRATAAGADASATGDKSTAIGQNANAKAKNSVALSADSIADEDNTISVGSKGNERRVTNVARGVKPNDAANKAQLDEVKSDVSQVKKDLRKTDRKLRAGIAGAAAVANIPQVTKAGGTMIGAGIGYQW